MPDIKKRVATVAALTAFTAGSAAGVAFAADSPAAPAGPGDRETATTYADIDGDGRQNAVTVREVDDNLQTLTFAFADGVVDTSFEADSSTPLQEPRRVDINGDGKDEVMVANAVGANTITFNIWTYEPGEGIVPLTTSAGAPFELYEGGGVSAINGYSCTADHSGSQFVTVEAQLAGTPDDKAVFDGGRITYSVNNNAMTAEARTPIDKAPAKDPVLATDPDSCTP